MKFLIDAQLPRRLALWLQQAGHDALHTLDLAQGNRTTDREIVRRANDYDRVVVTKDADFVNSFTIAREPRKLLLISTGNISNAKLNALLVANLSTNCAGVPSGGLRRALGHRGRGSRLRRVAGSVDRCLGTGLEAAESAATEPLTSPDCKAIREADEAFARGNYCTGASLAKRRMKRSLAPCSPSPDWIRSQHARPNNLDACLHAASPF